MPRLKGLARRTWFVNQTAMQSLEDAVGALAEAGLDTTVLGGAATALAPWGWAGDLKHRTLDDTAVMVLPADSSQAADVLRDHGWITPAHRVQERHRRLWQEIALVSPDDRPLRVVWNPSPWIALGSTPLPRHSVGSGPIHILSASDALLATSVDGMLSPHGLIWVADAHRIIATSGHDLDLDRVLGTAAEHGVSGVVVDAMELLRDVFASPLPSDLPATATGRPRLESATRRIGRLRSRPGGPARLQADWATVRGVGNGVDGLRGFVEFLTDRWVLESPRRVPMAAFHRLAGRLRRRGPRGQSADR
jgi:hypothetical protein